MSRRLLIRVVAFLLLGAIVNVAVAWGSRFLPLPRGNASIAHHGEWAISRKTSVFATITSMRRLPPAATFPMVVFAPIEEVLDEHGQECLQAVLRLDQSGSGVSVNVGVASARGYPMRALHGYVVEVANAGTATKVAAGVHAFGAIVRDIPDGDPGTYSFVPFRPLWPGFAINTVFYAFILWGLFAGPFVVRRWRRIRRGLCPKCAYDLRGTRGGAATACPECGCLHRHRNLVTST